MDFARKQLEKYGWSDGKGLGKNENGISEALKPKLKRSVTGIGHDPAAEFNEHWWSTLYNKAAENVEVQDKNGKTKKIKIKDDFNISTNTWQISNKTKNGDEKQYSEYFIRTEVLPKGGGKTEVVKEHVEQETSGNVVKLTDEELFAACEGRTAHKGARHGLRALGKLARIAEQEQMLLKLPKYNGYSHAKSQNDEEIVENLNLQPEVEEKRKKKKKKRKRCVSNEDRMIENSSVAESEEVASEEFKTIDNVAAAENKSENSRKRKSKKHNENELEVIPEKPKKKKKRKNIEMEIEN